MLLISQMKQLYQTIPYVTIKYILNITDNIVISNNTKRMAQQGDHDVLFIYYINDLPETINSDLKIFADDTKTFSEIKTTEDRDALQKT